jgi:hypothetical protein
VVLLMEIDEIIIEKGHSALTATCVAVAVLVIEQLGICMALAALLLLLTHLQGQA